MIPLAAHSLTLNDSADNVLFKSDSAVDNLEHI